MLNRRGFIGAAGASIETPFGKRVWKLPKKQGE